MAGTAIQTTEDKKQNLHIDLRYFLVRLFLLQVVSYKLKRSVKYTVTLQVDTNAIKYLNHLGLFKFRATSILALLK